MQRDLHPTQISNSTLHHRIIQHLLETGSAPTVDELSTSFNQPREAVISGLLGL